MARPVDTNETVKIKALTHPVRRKVLVALRRCGKDSPLSPREMARDLEMELANVSYHVRVLAELEAIHLARTTPVGNSLQHFYYPDSDFYPGWLPRSMRGIRPWAHESWGATASCGTPRSAEE
jgi:hypothetical protein